jgi:ppGpp synthetase/RelA/SpoT-type nucleotidyltranferase
MLPSSKLSKNQIDRLGDRLRKGDISEEDLRLLDSYRRSFSAAYEDVIQQIEYELGLEPTGRPAKSTTSIIDKLQRESIRLSQMQDIAGCRIVAPDLDAQDEAVVRLRNSFKRTTTVDRRDRPSHGYRAVHIMIDYAGRLIKIQVRTALQHLWAEMSEKISDVIDPAIKYGRGGNVILSFLASASDEIMLVELAEDELHQIQAKVDQESDISGQYEAQNRRGARVARFSETERC